MSSPNQTGHLEVLVPSATAVTTSNGNDTTQSSVKPEYTTLSSGTNEQGNHHCVRDDGKQITHHYSNADGSYAYKREEGSRYFNSGTGVANYTPNEKAGTFYNLGDGWKQDPSTGGK